MIYLNAGNVWTDTFLNKIIELNESHESIKVGSLFGSIAGLTPTARAADRLPYRDWAFVDRYVEKAQSHDIAIRYTLNQSCIGSLQDFKRDWEAKLKKDLEELHAIGVHEWTVTSSLLVELLSHMFPDDFIEVSTIAEISSIPDAVHWNDLSARGVNVSTNINRDLGLLERINEIMTVSVLANEACLYRCPYRRDCYNLSSHNSERSEDLFDYYPFRYCNRWRMEQPEEWLKARMILPQWMPIYQERAGIDWFKVTCRTHPEEVALPIIEAYMNPPFTGNLCDLWPTIAHLGDTDEPAKMTYISCEELDKSRFLDHWIGKMDMCSRVECGAGCTYCHEIYDKITGMDVGA